MTWEGTGAQGPDPRFLTDDTFMDEYLSHIEAGTPPYRAAELAGVSRRTLYGWLHKGGYPDFSRSEEEGFEPYTSFVEETLRAEAKAYVEVVEAVHAKAQTDGRVGVMYLKTRYPEDFGSKDEPTVIVQEKEVSARIDFKDILRLNKIIKEAADAED